MRATVLLILSVLAASAQAVKFRSIRRRLIVDEPVKNLTPEQKEYFVRLLWLIQHRNNTVNISDINNNGGAVLKNKLASGGFFYDSEHQGVSSEESRVKTEQSHYKEQSTYNDYHSSQNDNIKQNNELKIDGEEEGQSSNNSSQSNNNVYEAENPLISNGSNSKVLEVIQNEKINTNVNSRPKIQDSLGSNDQKYDIRDPKVIQSGESNSQSKIKSPFIIESDESDSQFKMNEVVPVPPYVIQSSENYSPSNDNMNPNDNENLNDSQYNYNEPQSPSVLQSVENNASSNRDMIDIDELQNSAEYNAQFNPNKSETPFVIQSAENNGQSNIDMIDINELQNSAEYNSQFNQNNIQTPFIIQSAENSGQSNVNVDIIDKDELQNSAEYNARLNKNKIQTPVVIKSAKNNGQSNINVIYIDEHQNSAENSDQSNKDMIDIDELQNSAEYNAQLNQHKIQTPFVIKSAENNGQSNIDVIDIGELQNSAEYNTQLNNNKIQTPFVIQSAENNGQSNIDMIDIDELQNSAEYNAQLDKNKIQTPFVIQSTENNGQSNVDVTDIDELQNSAEYNTQWNKNKIQTPFVIKSTENNGQSNIDVTDIDELQNSAEYNTQWNKNKIQTPFVIQSAENSGQSNKDMIDIDELQNSAEYNAQLKKNKIQTPFVIQSGENKIQSNDSEIQEPEVIPSQESNSQYNINVNQSPEIHPDNNFSGYDYTDVQQPQSDEISSPFHYHTNEGHYYNQDNTFQIEDSADPYKKIEQGGHFNKVHRYQSRQRLPKIPQSLAQLLRFIIKSDQSFQTLRIIPAPQVASFVVTLCENSNKNILGVWKKVAKYLGLDKNYSIKNIYEVEKLLNIIKVFVDLSKRADLKQMSLSKILAAIRDEVKVLSTESNQDNDSEETEDQSSIPEYSQERGLRIPTDSSEFWVETSIEPIPILLNPDESLEIPSDFQDSDEDSAEIQLPSVQDDRSLDDNYFDYSMGNHDISSDNSMYDSSKPDIDGDEKQTFVFNPDYYDSEELKEFVNNLHSSAELVPDSYSSDDSSNDWSISDESIDLLPVSPNPVVNIGGQSEEVPLVIPLENSDILDRTIDLLPVTPKPDVNIGGQSEEVPLVIPLENSDISDGSFDSLPVSPNPDVNIGGQSEEVPLVIPLENSNISSSDILPVSPNPENGSLDEAAVFPSPDVVEDNPQNIYDRSLEIQPYFPDSDAISKVPPSDINDSDIQPVLPLPNRSSELPFGSSNEDTEIVPNLIDSDESNVKLPFLPEGLKQQCRNPVFNKLLETLRSIIEMLENAKCL